VKGAVKPEAAVELYAMPRRLACAAAALIMLVVLAGCSGEPVEKEQSPVGERQAATVMPAAPVFESILVAEASALLDREQNTLIVDVRTPAERELLRIPGSLAVPFEEILQGQAQLPKDRPLLLICAVGGRSYAAGLYLAKQNYPLVYNLRGGIAAWEKAGLPLERGGAAIEQ